MKTFRHDFGGGVTCEVQFPDHAPSKEEMKAPDCFWAGEKLPRSRIREYIGWMNSVQKLVADEWNVNLMRVYMLSPNSGEIWVYVPGQPPKLQKKYNELHG